MRTVGDFTVAGQYVNGEPALVIWRATGEPLGSMVIGLSSAVFYGDPDYARRAVTIARRATEAMGFQDSMSTTLKLLRLINDSMSDLISMPPEPKLQEWSATVGVSVNGGRKLDMDVFTNVGIGQEVPTGAA